MLNFLRLFLIGRAALVAKNLFLRKQLALFQERKVRPRKTSASTRLSMLALARFFHWREALVIVKPETLIRLHRTAFRAFRCWKSRKPGRPPLPRNLRELIREIAAANPGWGQERIADELSLKLGIRVSPRTVGKCLDSSSPPGRAPSQHWATFVRNHAKGIVACDFMASVTASMEVGSRRILHTNVTAHPTAEWTLQQLRECFTSGHPYRFRMHDRDSIFSAGLDSYWRGFGLRVWKTPVRAPKANAYCERLIGTIRRECLDFLIPINERHLRRHLRRISGEFVIHYNRGRPHSALGPAIPHRHLLPAGYRVESTPVLGGLHYEYSLENGAARRRT